MHILLAFDGSPAARLAVACSGALFAGSSAVVVCVAAGVRALEDAGGGARVALPDEVIRQATASLRESALDEARGVAAEGARLARSAGFSHAEAHTREADEPVWSALVGAASAAGAAAIVCGSHGHNAVVRAVIGSVASGLAHHASAPVLVVPSKAPQADGPIVIGYDFSDASARAIEACGRLMPGRRAVVAHAWRSRVRHTAAASALRHVPLAGVRETTTDLDDILDGWETEDTNKGAVLGRQAGLDASGIAIETRVPAPTALLDLADDRDAPVLAVGRRGRGAVTSALLGSVSSTLVHAGRRPILVA